MTETKVIYEKPKWYEQMFLRCKNCGHMFFGFKIIFISKCPKCGSIRIEKNKLYVN